MNRGARHQSIFRDDRDRTAFLGILHDLHRDDGVEIHAYCLMGNHYHLVVQCPDGNLSSAMHHLGSRYAQRFNGHHGVDGPLFRGRFRSKSITTGQYLMEAVRYVHRNPLELSMAGGLAAYRWSSHAAYVGRAPRPRWLTCATLIELTGGDRPAFRAYVEGERASDARMVDRWGSQHLVDLVAIDQVVSQVLTQNEMVQVSDRVRPRLGRDLALVLAIDHRRASPAELAAHHGLASRSSVWSAVGRTRRRAESDATVRRLLERCRDAIEVSTLGA
jgi:REP element-mobilizing transposase RayT